MKTVLTDAMCNRILEQYPSIPKSAELYGLMRATYGIGRNRDVMQVVYKDAK